jgi:hypothetical protein
VSFSPSVWNKVSLPQVREALRDTFTVWGRPDTLRLDNGYPWAAPGELPTVLALWLVGLGVALHFNNPRSPQENGVVEHSHGTSSNWVEPQQCHSAEELQAGLVWTDRIQREEYPHSGAQSRLELFAELARPRHVYRREDEERTWDFGLAQSYLGAAVARRRVDVRGRVSVYAQSYYIGVMHRGQDVFVQYDPQAGEWVFADRGGAQLCRHQAEQITRARLLALVVSAKASHNPTGP